MLESEQRLLIHTVRVRPGYKLEELRFYGIQFSFLKRNNTFLSMWSKVPEALFQQKELKMA